MDEDKNNNKFPNFVAHAVAVVIAACIMAVVIALTVKFIFWLFPAMPTIATF